MYAVVGGGTDSNANFQISFKLRIYEPEDKNARGILGNMYLGYTQNSFWDLTSDSKPFTDTNYAPSVFYFVPSTDWRLGGNAVGLAAGYEHESNGKDGLDSRSIDILFVRPYFSFGDTRDFHWSVSPKVYAYLDKSENPEITQYRGYADLNVSYGKNDDWQIATMLRSGTKSNTYSATLRGTYPLNRLVPGLSGYFMAQFFNGYGENLLGYSERDSSSLRIGYAVSR
jgi:outer membrane phospholipase A